VQGPPSAPGLFPGGKAGAALAEIAFAEGFLEEAAAPQPATSKSKKAPPRHARITERGRRHLLESDSPGKAIEGIRSLLEVQGTSAEASLAALHEQLASWRDTLQNAEQAIRDQVSGYRQTASVLQRLLERTASEPAAVPAPAFPASSSPTPPGADWLDEVVHFVSETKRRNSFARPTLPQIYEELKKTRPRLTLGQFHDGLRTLHEQRRVLLGPYSQNTASIPDASNALYLDREVKFYVDLP
jgi:hypothetical protein